MKVLGGKINTNASDDTASEAFVSAFDGDGEI